MRSQSGARVRPTHSATNKTAPMRSNLLIIGFRVVWKDRLYAAINLVGLAVAFAAALLIALWLRFETSWEPYLQEPDRVVGIALKTSRPNGSGMQTMDTPVALKSELDAAFGDRLLAARYGSDGLVVANGERRFVERVAFVDPGFFRVMTMPFLAGDPAHALDAPDSAVLTRSAAQKYFGSADPMGRTLDLHGKATLRVTGVIADLPDNTLFQNPVFVAMLPQGGNMVGGEVSQRWNSLQSPTLVRLGANLGEAELQSVLDRLSTEKYDAQRAAGVIFQLYPVPIRDAHLLGIFRGYSGGTTPLATLAMVAVLILAIAAINFVNLATARATRRTREVGVRKALGASRFALVLQLLAEPFLIAVAASLLALAAIETSLPLVSKLLGARLEFAYWREPLFFAALVLGGP
jgi:putative ABC transport system permease protein